MLVLLLLVMVVSVVVEVFFCLIFCVGGVGGVLLGCSAGGVDDYVVDVVVSDAIGVVGGGRVVHGPFLGVSLSSLLS